MSKPRRTLAATELRVHLGEALRALEHEELVIEKGGIPVALLIKYEPEGAGRRGSPSSGASIEEEYERALSHRAEPGGWKRMDEAMESGWAGIEAEEMVANIYRWRGEGRTEPDDRVDDPGWEAKRDDGDLSARQRRLHSRRAPGTHVADGDDSTYEA